METNRWWRTVAVVGGLAVVLAGCGDDGDDRVTPCEAATELQGSLQALNDAEPGDIGDAAETVADDFATFRDSVGDASRDAITELSDQIDDLKDAVADGNADDIQDGLADVDEAWDGLVEEIQQSSAECDLSSIS